MGLSCECDYDYDGDGWYWRSPRPDLKQHTGRRKRCCSCGDLIQITDLITRFQRLRAPLDLIEERIHGDEVYLAPWVMCERCSDLFWSLTELGYCIQLGDDMRELVGEYADMAAEARQLDGGDGDV